MDIDRGENRRSLDDLNQGIRKLVSRPGRQAPKYRPLSKSDSICLAYFSRIGSHLYCRLKHVSISQKLGYHALSYVWRWRPTTNKPQDGDENATRPIFVDGQEV